MCLGNWIDTYLLTGVVGINIVFDNAMARVYKYLNSKPPRIARDTHELTTPILQSIILATLHVRHANDNDMEIKTLYPSLKYLLYLPDLPKTVILKKSVCNTLWYFKF